MVSSLFVTACGGGGGSSAKTASTAATATASASPASTPAAASTPAPTASATPAGSPAQSPTPAATPSTNGSTPTTPANASVTVTATDYDFSSKTVTAHAGPLHFQLENAGGVPHNLVVVKTDAAPNQLKVVNGQVSTAGQVGQIPATAPATLKDKTFHLKAGHYVFFCSIPGHYQRGMRGELIVK